MLWGGDYNARHPDCATFRRTHARDKALKQTLDTVNLTRLGKLVTTYRYVSKAANEERGTPRVLASTIIDHIHAGTAAAAFTSARRPGEPLGSKDTTGHRVQHVAATAIRSKSVEKPNPRDRPPRLDRMPKSRSAKQIEEWKEANPEVPESEMPKIGWDVMLSDANDVAWSAINKCNADSADVRARASERTCAVTDALKLLAHDAMETKATVGKRPPSRRHAAERVAAAWACQVDAATQRKAVPKGALPHAITEAEKHCKGFEVDEELRDFYENPQGSKTARSRVELSLLHTRHSAAVAAHATLLDEQKWHTLLKK